MLQYSANHKKLVAFLVLVCLTQITLAHTINYQLERAPVNHVIRYYILSGIRHIIPDGFDHILFITGLCLLNTKWKTILLQATAFTVAHSITLALSMKGIIMLPSPVVEPLIALTILFVAVENIILSELKPWRIVIVFLFGLIHGLGFASALNEAGLPRNRFLTSVLSFNIGVEAGQIIVILLVFGLLIIPFKKSTGYRKTIVYPASILIALIAGYWTVQRIFY